jgi:putative Mg2+ transporter-C (MgtC) family protein
LAVEPLSAVAAVATPSLWALTARILVAAGIGGAIGFEREYRGQPAGFRTHILVAVGSSLFTLVGVVANAGNPGVDPTRIAAQVVTGIGFLGAGAIIHQGVNVRGLTTAATLWVTAAIGTATGIGYISGALVASGVTIVALVVLKRLERALFPDQHPTDDT